MRRAKTVTLESRRSPFSTQGEAQKYYKEIVKNLFESKEVLNSGQNFEEMKEIYTLYCQYTDYKLDRLKENEISGFKADYEVRENSGTHSTTACCFVIFSNDEVEPFSTDKAIKEIADIQNKA